MLVTLCLSFIGLLPDVLIKHASRKIYARKNFIKNLKNMVEELAPCVRQRDVGSPGNLHAIIGQGRDLIRKQGKTQEITNKLNLLFKRLLSLEKGIDFFQDTIEQPYFSYTYTGRLSKEFIEILSDSAQIFGDFVQILQLLGKNEYGDVSQKLKGNKRGYPAFRRIWDNAVGTYTRVSREAREKLKDILVLPILEGLPEL